MPAQFPLVPLGEVLTERKEVPSPEQLHGGEVRIVSKIGFDDGKIQLRVDGQTKTGMILIRPGDLVVSGINAAKGAIAIYSEENKHSIAATIHYGSYIPNKNRVDTKYLWWLLRSNFFRDLLFQHVPGGIKTELKAKRFLPVPIPLPPLTEQRRIVARIEDLAAKIEEAKGLKGATARESRNFWKILSRIARETDYPERTLGEVVEFLDGQRIPLSEAERSTQKGAYPYYGASGIIDSIDSYIFDEELLLLSEDGANLINRSTPIAFIASGKYWVNNHAHVLRPLPNVVDIDFLQYALSDYDVSMFNFASAQAKLNQKNAMKISFPVPRLDEQRRIVAYLDGLQSKVDALKQLQAETQKELDAMLPSVLDKAFKGEL